jgi:uncharacterized OB-fold protein
MAGARPLPVKTQEGMPFWEGCKRGELLLQQCDKCHAFQWFPRAYCRDCSNDKLTWIRASGRGRVVSFSIVRKPINQSFASMVPYVLAVVELDEGIRMMTNIVDAVSRNVKADDVVQVVFEEQNDDVTIPLFRLVDEK